MSKFSILNKSNKKVDAKSGGQTEKEGAIHIDKDFTHAMITGQTGCGKTTSAILPIMDDRIKSKYGLLIFDYKGGEHFKIKYLAKKYKRLKDVVMINVPWGERINITAEASEKLLQNFFKLSFGGKNDPFWANMATGIALKSISLLASIDEFNKSGFCELMRGRLEDATPNIKNLFKHTQAISNFRVFYDTVKEYKNYIRNGSDVLKSFQNFKNDPADLRAEVAKNIHKLIAVKDKVSSFLETFSEYAYCANHDTREQKEKFYGNYSFMLLALQDLADSKFLNHDGASISSLLNDGKIVIINCAGLNDNATELMINSTLSNLVKRIAKSDKNPVSVFIDEAQRVLNGSTDLYADVLREAKVELILAFQNEDILKQSIGGEARYKELVGNLSHQYFFKNSQKQYADGANRDFSKLSSFEYYHEGQIYKAKPMFIKENDLLKAELAFQKLHNIASAYTTENIAEDEVLIYNEELYRANNSFICKRISDGSIRQVIYLNERTKNELDELFKSDEYLYIA